MRVFQIQQEINAVVQGDRTIQEYSLELAKLWEEFDNFSQVSSCCDPNCMQKEFLMQMRTMHFLDHLNPAFHQRRSVLLAQKEIPSLDEAIAAMMQEESCMLIHTDQGVVVNAWSALGVRAGEDARSAWGVSGSGMASTQGETRKCFNCGETGHLMKTCRKSWKDKDVNSRGQNGGRGHGRGGRRGGGVGNRANLMVAEEGEESGMGLSEDDMIVKAASEIVKRRQREAEKAKGEAEDASSRPSSTGNHNCVAYTASGTHDTLALATIPFTRSSDWIIDSGASHHVTSTISEFSSYT